MKKKINGMKKKLNGMKKYVIYLIYIYITADFEATCARHFEA